MAVAGQSVSALPAVSVSKLLGLLAGVALFQVLVVSGRGVVWHQRAADLLIAAGVAVALLGLVSTNWAQAEVISLPGLRDLYERIPTLVRGLPGSGVPRTSDLANPRELGGTLSLLIPLAAIQLLLAPARPARRGLLAAATLVMTAVLLLTQTISGIAGVVVAVAVGGLLLWLRTQGRLVALIAGVMAPMVSIGLWLVGQLVTPEAPGAAGVSHIAFGLASRLELWPRALWMIQDMPYTGVGLNLFPYVLDRFYPGFELGPEPHAHNFLLQTAIDLGLPGLAALVWLLIAFAGSVAQGYRATEDQGRRAVLLGLGISVGAYLIFGTIDAVTQGAKPGILFWAVLGAGAGLAHAVLAEAGLRPRPNRWLMVSGILLIALALLAPLAWDGPRSNAARVVAYRALLSDPPDQSSRATALELQSGLLAASPGSARGWYLLGSLQTVTAQAPEAVQSLRQGVFLDSIDPLPRYDSGRMWPRRGEDWEGLLAVYRQWTVRFPAQAEWHVTTAIALCEGRHDRMGAQAVIAEATKLGAQPEALVAAYRSVVVAPESCR